LVHPLAIRTQPALDELAHPWVLAELRWVRAYSGSSPRCENHRERDHLLTRETVAMLDEAAKALGMCRSDVIRRSLTRDLGYVMSREVPTMQRFHQETSAAHVSWLNSKRWFG
jgi:hypothetical protein